MKKFKFKNFTAIYFFNKNYFNIDIKYFDLLIFEVKKIYYSKNSINIDELESIAISLMKKLYFTYETNRKLYGECFKVLMQDDEFKKLFINTNFFIDINHKYDIYVYLNIFSFMDNCLFDIFVATIQEQYFITLHYDRSPIKTFSLPIDRIREKKDFKLETIDFFKKKIGN